MATEETKRASQRDSVTRAMAGWQPARVLMVANRLGVFTVLGEKQLSAEEIADCCGTHPRSTALLLNACVSLGLLQKEKELYGNSPESRESLVKGKPTYLGDAINHADRLWWVWAHLEKAVRTNRPAPASALKFSDHEALRDFILAMHNRAMRIGPFMAESLDLSGKRQLLDVGGGPGTYSLFLAKKYPQLRAIVFDLPPVIKIAEEIIASFNLMDRVTTRAGDYFQNNFGSENDVVLLSMVLHSMSPAKSKLLLRKAYSSLVSGGYVVVHEGLIDPEGTAPVSAVLFSLNMLLNTGGGQSYSEEEIGGWMKEIGFVQPSAIPLPPERTSLVVATRP